MAPLRQEVGFCCICGQVIPKTDLVQLPRRERARLYVARSFGWFAHVGCRAALTRTLAPYLARFPTIRADNQVVDGVLGLEPTPF
jgi:hypothetical protein